MSNNTTKKHDVLRCVEIDRRMRKLTRKCKRVIHRSSLDHGGRSEPTGLINATRKKVY